MENRRKFIKTSLLVGTGLLFAPTTVAQTLSQDKKNKKGKGKKVCVIGAGFSGLASAHQLTLMGYDVTVLESRNRIGGRVFSHRLPSDHVVELGAEWVGASHERMIQLCNEFGLVLENNQFDTHLIYKGKYSIAGQWDFSEKWKASYERLLAKYEHLSKKDEEKLDQMDWWRCLVNHGCEGKDLDLKELLDSTDFGESIRNVSGYSALAEYAESSPKNEMDFKIKGGNVKLAEKFAEKIGMQNILLNHTVSHINQSKKVKITCTDGNVFECDKIICTIPTFALTKIKWTPELPSKKVDAINELQYARINKHVMTFNDRFWKDESFDMITDECPHYFYHGTKNQSGTSGVLISYSVGEKAAIFGNRSYEAAKKDICATLEPHFGEISSKMIHQTNFYWGNEEHSQGAYALYGKDQWFKLRPILAKPFLDTHFAGEHLADWQGFMEGAIVTGEEAALAI